MIMIIIIVVVIIIMIIVVIVVIVKLAVSGTMGLPSAEARVAPATKIKSFINT